MNDHFISHNSLSISCVVYDTDPAVVADTILSLKGAIETATSRGTLNSYKFFLINNQEFISESFQNTAALAIETLKSTEIISGHGNIGYGRANNLAIDKSTSDFHLILNPDVKIDPNALHEGLAYFDKHPDVGLLAPNAYDENGDPEYLCKRPPSPLVIFLRGINSNSLNRIFRKSLDRYAYKDMLPSDKTFPIELASGCFMLCRTDVLKKVGGFSPEYFLYFEDFDLSRKIEKKVFLPSMRITHLGGRTAGKGWRHIKMFLRSYLIFLKAKNKKVTLAQGN